MTCIAINIAEALQIMNCNMIGATFQNNGYKRSKGKHAKGPFDIS